MTGNDKNKDVIDTVQVALRIRPLCESETSRGCEECVEVINGEPQVQVKDLLFTYNYVFPQHIGQEEFYDTCVKGLIVKLFQGYNVTILAYGQTGSGKTYTMGTDCSGCDGDSQKSGVIPQAVGDIFDYVEANEEEFEFKVSVSFMELYQEQCYDLLSGKPRSHSVVEIREDHRGVILPGLTELPVTSAGETMLSLIRGSAGRAVGSTAMNMTSSRSHAIFTIQIAKESRADKNQATTSKFHLVDLAGSERIKKTKATGDRLKEGVKINQGLLALGNVISALGDGTNKGYICYRESKLTRLLQDSLGGNSLTMMVACVSPADYNMEETVSTLRYADRARRIRNKPVVNQDAKAAEIVRLNDLINELRLQLLGKAPIVTNNGGDLSEQLEKEKQKYSELLQKHKEVTDHLSNMLVENTNLCEKALLAEAAKDKMERKLTELTELCNHTIENMNLTYDKLDEGGHRESFIAIKNMKSMLEDLQSVQVKCNEELMDHDIRGLDSKEDNDAEAIGDEPEADDKLMGQVALNKELQELNHAMATKASLVRQMVANTREMLAYDESLKENEARVAALEKERSELLQQLKSVQAKSKDPSVEERRCKVASLEHEITDLKKKCQQQANIIRVKERNEAKIQALNNELQAMKATKVRIIKEMRAANEKFRRWKADSDRAVLRLKTEDRKRATAMAKMENMHVKQQNVLKRKMEEAVAINKRLKEALERQRVTQVKRARGNNKVEAIQQWVEQELEIQLSTVDATKTLEELMEHRGMIVAEIEKLRSDADNYEENKSKVTELENDLALRKAQISDLQQKILIADQENKMSTRWDNVQSMLEAKCALKYLFELIVECKREMQSQRDGAQLARHQQLQESYEALSHRYEQAVKDFRRQLSDLEMQHEEKVSALMALGRGVNVTGDGTDACAQLQQHIRFQEERLQTVEAENERLQQELEQLRSLSKPRKTKKAAERRPQFAEVLDDEEEELDSDDPEKDPEWRNTPLYKRLQAQQRSRLTMNFSQSEGTRAEGAGERRASKGVKRGSDGAPQCACRGACSTRICSCRKAGAGCGEHCKCPRVLCKNRRDDEDSDDKENTTPPIAEVEVSHEHTPSYFEKRDTNDTFMKRKRLYFFYPPQEGVGADNIKTEPQSIEANDHET